MLTLASIFCDGLIFQAGKPIRVFGTGAGKVTVTLCGNTVSGEFGKREFGQAKWALELPALPYGGPFEMFVKLNETEIVLKDVCIGDVYVMAGQSNMQFTLSGSDYPKDSYCDLPHVRLYTPSIPRDNAVFFPEDGWVYATAENAGNWSALGWLISKFLREKRGTYIGIISIPLGASAIQAWLPEEVFEDQSLVVPEDQRTDMAYPWNAGCAQLYHATFEQVFPYSAEAVVWYQGESNYSEPESLIYGRLLEQLISVWRRDMMDLALKFVIIQIADYYKRDCPAWHRIQDAQLEIETKVANVKTVICRDVCETDNIHPPHKTDLAKRVADVLLKSWN